MGHVRDTFHVDAPIDACWELATNPYRLTEWQSGLIETKDISGPTDRAGAGYTATFRLAGRKLDGHFEATRVEKPNLLEFKGTSPGGGKVSGSTRFQPASGGTDVTTDFTIDLPGGFLGDIADKLFLEKQVERELKHSNENFKALCEAKVPAHA